MDKKYTLISAIRGGRPRSKRLQKLGAGSGSSVVVNSILGNAGASSDGHTHDNKSDLDRISTDGDGYEYITRTVQTTDSETGETSIQAVPEKVKAGYADKAGDLTEDSPVLKLINTIGNQFVPTYLDGSAYVDTTWAEIVAGTRTLAAIKSVKGFFSDSFISARGANSAEGGSTGGAYYLSELLDTAISNPASGQALVYNGTKWANQAIQTGLDEAALASYLTTHSYATQQWVESKGYLTAHQSLANYVTLNTPQNITANKVFYGEERFVANGLTYTDPWSGIVCAIKVTGKVGITDSIKAASFIKSDGTSSQFLKADGSVDGNAYLTTVNAAATYVSKAGDTMTGALRMGQSVASAPASQPMALSYGRLQCYGTLNINGNTDNSGNEFVNITAGHGLSASTADGLSIGTNTLTWQNQTVWHAGNDGSGSGLDADFLDGYQETAYFRSNIGSIAVADIMTKLPGNRSGSYQITQTGWNGSAVVLYAGGSNSGLAFYRPGGSNSIPKILVAVDSTSTWTDKGTIVTTSEGNAPSATKLQTARTLWGQSFNGTANVSGSLTGVSSIGFNGNYELGIHNGRYVFGTTGQVGAVGANAGSLLVSNMWADATKVPTNGIYVKGDLRIGDITLSYDAANGGLHVSGGGLYADSYITARGANTSGGGSTGGGLIQQVYGSSSLGGAFSDTTLTDTFNAYTINKIRTDLMSADSALSGRITSLEGGAAVSVTTTGSGNAITAISKSGTTITATKGATFLTQHQSLANYVPWSKQSVATVNGTNHNPQFFNIENENLIANYKNYWSVINFGSYSGNNFRSQIAMPYQDSITDTDMFIRTANGSNWRAWRRVLHDGNYASILDSRYYTESEINTKLGNYVTLNTTQTITGLKTFSAAGTTAIFNSTGTIATNVVLKTNGTQRSSIGWYNNFVFISNEPGYTGASTDKYHRLGITDAGVPQFWTNRDGSKYTLLHEGNYTTILDSRYYTESEINAKLTNGSVTKVGTTTVGSTAKGIYLNGGTPTALSATVGAANRPVYMNAGTITAGTYTFGNGSGNAPISNGTLCTNLNADLLDGLHNGALTARYLNLAAFVTNCNAVPTHNGIFSWSGTNSANPATYGVLLQWSSVDNPTPGTDQHWITQLASATSNRLFYRTRINTGAWSGWSAVAFTSDNVASATKLQTARTLWGQSFNGTANVDGALTVHHTGACGVYISGGGESSYSCQASGGLRWVSGAYPDRYFIWDSSGNGNERLTILNNGSVGIGTTYPSAKLDVIGVIHSTAGMWSNGYVSARGQNTASDARLKNILQTKLLDTRSIAAAPSVLFRWKDDDREDVGSIAQYWQRIDHHLVSHRPDGYLGLDYGKAALLSVISVAKQTLNHEERIKALERENALLKEQIKSLT